MTFSSTLEPGALMDMLTEKFDLLSLVTAEFLLFTASPFSLSRLCCLFPNDVEELSFSIRERRDDDLRIPEEVLLFSSSSNSRLDDDLRIPEEFFVASSSINDRRDEDLRMPEDFDGSSSSHNDRRDEDLRIP